MQGKGQPVSARIVNLATEAGVPQGALAAERSTLNAIVKVGAPSPSPHARKPV